jgi:hypothetical protein
VRLLYHRLIADQGFPLELKVPMGFLSLSGRRWN